MVLDDFDQHVEQGFSGQSFGGFEMFLHIGGIRRVAVPNAFFKPEDRCPVAKIVATGIRMLPDQRETFVRRSKAAI